MAGPMIADSKIERSQVVVVKTLIECCGKQGVDASSVAKVGQ